MQSKFQNVTAGWILDLCGRIRMSHFTRITRVLKVVE